MERDKRIPLVTEGFQHGEARFGDIGDHGPASAEAARIGHGLVLEEDYAIIDLLPDLGWRRHPIVDPAQLLGLHVVDAIADVFGEVGHLAEDLLRNDGGLSIRGAWCKMGHSHELALCGYRRLAVVDLPSAAILGGGAVPHLLLGVELHRRLRLRIGRGVPVGDGKGGSLGTDPGGVDGLLGIWFQGGISDDFRRLRLDGLDVRVAGRISLLRRRARWLLLVGAGLVGDGAALLALLAAVLDHAAHDCGFDGRNLLVDDGSGGGAGVAGGDLRFISIKIITVDALRA